ncbi:unnamed protein product [Brachionus calyciflorus]|uniref:EGF-like domain-containing protein n=1 Tax=Brachionus calyciflorus TaxID=104777 RepID=A0A813P355_9BILA|nr:unnamed protein product [Brachionus calyciflorus]
MEFIRNFWKLSILLICKIDLTNECFSSSSKLFKANKDKENFLRQFTCGISTASSEILGNSLNLKRIINGEDADPKDFPWVVLVMSDIQRCTGTLISYQHVLTAAHCVIDSNSISDLVVALYGLPESNRYYKVSSVLNHPSYKGNEHDLAILKLSKKIDKNFEIYPICIPKSTNPGAIFEMSVLVSGWGSTNVQSDGVMNTNLKKTILNVINESNICFGDSGGPLMFYANFNCYSGSINAQSCTAGFCGSNGVCVIKDGSPVCECRTGFVGSRCQLNDLCEKRPCGTTGACFSVVQVVPGTSIEQASYLCQCYSGYYGTNCELALPRPCSSNPCLNSGVCVEKLNSYDYYCECVGPYTGANCGTYVDFCANNRCVNDAICVPQPSIGNYTCSCISGFYGNFCEMETNECIVTVNGVETSPCKNNATCYDLIDGYFCSCNGPYGGFNCETYVNPCSSNPCGAGTTCTSVDGSYVCNCKQGYFGNPCQPNPCNSNPCKQPNSKCIPVESGAIQVINIPGCNIPVQASYVCVCPGSFPEYGSQLC